MKRLLAMIVLCAYLICFAGCACAENTEQRVSEIIVLASLKLSKSNGAIVARANMSCTRDCDELGFSTLYIQEHRDGVWTTVTSTSGHDNNADIFTKSLVYANLKSGKQYRAKCTYYVKDGGTTEKRYRTSDILTV